MLQPNLWTRSQSRITPDDLSPAVGICSIISIVFAAVSLAARIFTKLVMIRKLDWDDHIIFLAMGLATAHVSTIVVAAENGLGRRLPPITPQEQGLLDKTAYAADLFFVTVMPLTKISMALLVTKLAPADQHRRVAFSYAATVAVWGVVSLFITAFLCQTGVPLLLGSDYDCYNRAVAFWNAFNALNALFEIFLIFWPMYIFLEIQVHLKQRMIVVAWFSTRVTILAAIVTQLVYLNKLSFESDRTFEVRYLAICTECVQALAIITTCIPCVRPFLEVIKSGLLRSELLHGRRANGSYFSLGSLGGNHQASVDSNKSGLKKVHSIARGAPVADKNRERAGQDTRYRANVPTHDENG